MSIKNSAAKELKLVGLDVHKDSITSAVLEPGHEVAVLDRFFHDETSVRRFVSTLGDPSAIRASYEARFELAMKPVRRATSSLATCNEWVSLVR